MPVTDRRIATGRRGTRPALVSGRVLHTRPDTRSGKPRNSTRFIWLCALPAPILVAVFFGVPIFQAIRISLSDWPGGGPISFIGLDNYVSQLTSPGFFSSLALTFGFAIASAAGIVILATVLAAAVSRNVSGSRFYRVVWFIPGVAPAAAVAVYWSTAFQPVFGTVSTLAGFIGLGNNLAPLADPKSAIYPVIFVSIWSGVGFAFILILGAMEQIPVSVYEAAQLDGASVFRQFFSLTLPLARPVLAVTATLNLIWAFNNFSTVFGMTGGGPGTATTTLPILVYKTAFRSGDYGNATTVAVLAAIILLILGFLALRITGGSEKTERS